MNVVFSSIIYFIFDKHIYCSKVCGKIFLQQVCIKLTKSDNKTFIMLQKYCKESWTKKKCDTEDWSNDAENSAFAITGIY